MKPFLIILSSFLLLSLDKDKSFYKANYLKGKIASLEESTYFVNELGEKTKFLMTQSIYKFDTLGVLLEETNVTSKGTDFTRKIFANDAEGRALQIEFYAKHGRLDKKQTFVYDKNGNCIRKYFFKADGKTVSEKNVYKFDKNGNEIEFNKYLDDTSKMITKTTYKYDSRKNKIESIMYKADLKSINGTEKFKYDNAGNVIEYIGLNDKGQQHKKIEYKYDKDNNLIEYKGYRGSESTLVLWTKSKFDDNHNCTETVYLNPEGKVEETNTYEFTYDKTGNWIKQKRSTNGGLNQIIERKISYF
jgi:hypothetical protein